MSVWNWCPEDPIMLGMHAWGSWTWNGKKNTRKCRYCGYVETR